MSLVDRLRALVARWRGAALVRAGRFDVADATLEFGLALRPLERGLLKQHALSAHNSGRYSIAVERWERVRTIAPDIEMGHAGVAANLRELGALDRAEAAIGQGRARFGDTITIVTEAARIAAEQGRFADARDLWAQAIALRRPHPDWLQGHAHALVRLGAFDEAEVALRAARAAHLDHSGLLGVEGALLAGREDWPRAVEHWRAYRRLHPDDPTGWEQLGIAVEANAHRCATAPLPVPLPAQIDAVEDEAMRRLLLRFESIGDDCEFGLVQRRYGAEPLGLLRWNTVTLEALIAALEARFAGMGDPANTRIVTAPNGEFYVEDTRWSLGMHTFLHAGGADSNALLDRMCKRVAYLRDKFLDDLAAAEKIFVYRSPGLDETRIEALHRALAGFGPVQLLVVQPASDSGGAVARIADRRFAGTLRRPGVDANGRWNIAYEDWTSICRQVAAA